MLQKSRKVCGLEPINTSQIKICLSTQERLEDEQSTEKEQGNEYLDLEQPEDVPVVRRVSRHELDLMFGTGITPTPSMPSPQKVMNEKFQEF